MRLTAGMKYKTYTLEERIGHGASGEVWRATDGVKTVAIKFMNENLMRSASAEKHRLRLEREVEALRRLQHPNVPTLYDYDLNSDRPWIAMRYIGGQTYDKLISSGEILRIPLDTRLNAIKELAMALKTAHSLGIVHRDIKPSNISGIETPYLLDFSISLPTSDVMHTVFNVGTSFYMDPEDPPNEMADNYAFALVAYEILFGTHAIFTKDDLYPMMPEATRFEAGERIRNRMWRFPSTIPADELPADLRSADLLRLDDVFEKAISPRATRYTDLNDFVNDMIEAIKSPSRARYAAPGVDRESPTMLEGTAPAPQPPQQPNLNPPVQASRPIPTDDAFTVLEVEGDKRGTAAPPPDQEPEGEKRGGVLGRLFGRKKDQK